MQEIHSKVKAVPCIDPAAIKNGNATTTGATIDALGYEGIEFIFINGVLTDGTIATTVFGGNASNMSDEVQLTNDAGAHPGLLSADLAIVATDDSATDRQGVDVAKAGFRYYRIKATQAGATTGGFYCAAAFLVNPRVMPVADQKA